MSHVTELYSLPDKLYTHGYPVIISSGTLYKDTMSNRTYAHLGFQNISSQNIVGLVASIHVYPFT